MLAILRAAGLDSAPSLSQGDCSQGQAQQLQSGCRHSSQGQHWPQVEPLMVTPHAIEEEKEKEEEEGGGGGGGEGGRQTTLRCMLYASSQPAWLTGCCCI